MLVDFGEAHDLPDYSLQSLASVFIRGPLYPLAFDLVSRFTQRVGVKRREYVRESGEEVDIVGRFRGTHRTRRSPKLPVAAGGFRCLPLSEGDFLSINNFVI
jgi:hypothetical protein